MIRTKLTLALTVAMLALAGPVAADTGSYRTQSFDTDPGWTGWQNIGTAPCWTINGSFGWTPTGEIGGTFYRSTSVRGWYATPIPPVTLSQPLAASGTIVLPVVAGGSGGGVTFGWFNQAESFDQPSASSLLLLISGDHRAGWQMNAQAVSRTYLAGGTVNAAGQKGAVVPYGVRFRWTVTYDGAGHLNLLIVDPNGAIADSGSKTLDPHLLADGATMDMFGFQDLQSAYGGPIQVLMDDLVVNGVPYSFDTDPGWNAVNNQVSQPDCVIPDRQNYGWASSSGEAGGSFWRGDNGYYADMTSRLSLSDVLYASGTIRLTQDTTDTDLYVGWFNDGLTDPAASTFAAVASGRSIAGANMLAAHIGGPTTYAYRFTGTERSAWDPATGKNLPGGKLDGPQGYAAPLLVPHAAARSFTLCYLPGAPGVLTVTLGPDPVYGLGSVQSRVSVPAVLQDSRTWFDRFGFLVGGVGGHSASVSLDDVRYTVAPGETPC